MPQVDAEFTAAESLQALPRHAFALLRSPLLTPARPGQHPTFGRPSWPSGRPCRRASCAPLCTPACPRSQTRIRRCAGDAHCTSSHRMHGSLTFSLFKSEMRHWQSQQSWSLTLSCTWIQFHLHDCKLYHRYDSQHAKLLRLLLGLLRRRTHGIR